jgi:dTDP-4-amino-4,6-dideoxygalactose transaminase
MAHKTVETQGVVIASGLQVPSPRPRRADDMDTYRIPFNRPSVVGREYAYITDSVATGQISGDGFYSRQCHALLEKALGVERALLTTSCTHALEMAAMLLDIQEGDEVIVPSFTFVSTANAFALRGARIVFADVRPDTLNLDESRLESLMTSRTRAIVVVHYAGVGCEMDAILAIAQRHGVKVIEDNAHGLFGAYKGKPLGTLGVLAAQSFHETKNFICGEGGALLINDAEYIARAEIRRERTVGDATEMRTRPRSDLARARQQKSDVAIELLHIRVLERTHLR